MSLQSFSSLCLVNNTIRFVKYHTYPGKVICLQDPILHALPADPQLLHSGSVHFVTRYGT